MLASRLAALQSEAFADLPKAPWTARALGDAAAGGAILVVDDAMEPEAFALARTAADEAELLTIAVARSAQRRGLGRTLLAEVEEAALAAGAATLFVEVAEANVRARAFYAAAGYREIGRRRGYYGSGMDALCLSRLLAKFGA